MEAALEAIGFGEWREEVRARVAARTSSGGASGEAVDNGEDVDMDVAE